ncbi:hypothetical protein ATANTOWER_021441 [Ataeniobius toweri]|uniref:Uncharacterized protein n=1 Tax=Ataeniobius toweri TaxID=208326 RepID=A0ABU7AIQ0_9TELE|nr:hypothetical protein [Ataeniobius toweri]
MWKMDSKRENDKIQVRLNELCMKMNSLNYRLFSCFVLYAFTDEKPNKIKGMQINNPSYFFQAYIWKVERKEKCNRKGCVSSRDNYSFKKIMKPMGLRKI